MDLSFKKALHDMARQLGNGQHTYLWHHSWLPEGKLIDQVGVIPVITGNWVVSDINGSGRWILRNSELIPIWQYIIQHPVPSTISLTADT